MTSVSPTPKDTEAERREAAAAGQEAAKRLWESLPTGTPVVVEFLGSGPRRARRTDIGWESDDGMTGCTPWSVRVEEVWLRASDLLAVSPAITEGEQAAPEAEAVRAVLTELSQAALTFQDGRPSWPFVAGWLNAEAGRRYGDALACAAPSPAVTAAEDETPDPDHCALLAPHLPHWWGPEDVVNLPNRCVGVKPAPVVAAVPADPEKRAPVQRDGRDRPGGTVAWSEHVEAWTDYAQRYGTDQSAQRIAERGGFGYAEMTKHLGHEPTTWLPYQPTRTVRTEP